MLLAMLFRRRPARSAALTGTLALALALTLVAFKYPKPAREVFDPSQYGFTGPRGCVLPSTPPHFFAMAMRAASRAEAESLAWRLGLRGKWEQDLYVCELQGDGALVWVAGPRMAREVLVPPGPVAALAHRAYEPDDAELPMGVFGFRRPSVQRLIAPGEVASIGAPIALVHSVDRVVKEWPPAKSEGDDVPLLPFGPWIEYPELGARARRTGGSSWGGTSALVMEPIDADGRAAHWLAERGPGWIGFEVPFMNLAATRTALESRGVHAREALFGHSLWLPPSETGGALIVFTPPPESRP